MRVHLAGQPSIRSTSLFQFLAAGCADEQYDRLYVATAWAKQSGLLRVQDDLAAFRRRGGSITMIVGISEGGATRQGLSMVNELCDQSFVFHDQGRTFHPKVYFFQGPRSASLFIGSNNLTAGGMYWNYEAALSVELDLRHDSDVILGQEISNWFSALRGEVEICRPLDCDLIDLLASRPEYRIGDESKASRDTAERTMRSPEAIFGKSTFEKHKDPIAKKRKRLSLTLPIEDAKKDLPLESSEIITYSWFKKLTHSDAQQKKTERTQVTGNLRLGRANHQIDHKSFFRERFFSLAEWVVEASDDRGNLLEVAEVPFEVVIGSKSHGIVSMRVDHATKRVSGQNNVPTWLKWGTYMGKYLREHDHVGEYVTIEAFADGTYRLTISIDPIGEIVNE